MGAPRPNQSMETPDRTLRILVENVLGVRDDPVNDTCARCTKQLLLLQSVSERKFVPHLLTATASPNYT